MVKLSFPEDWTVEETHVKDLFGLAISDDLTDYHPTGCRRGRPTPDPSSIAETIFLLKTVVPKNEKHIKIKSIKKEKYGVWSRKTKSIFKDAKFIPKPKEDNVLTSGRLKLKNTIAGYTHITIDIEYNEKEKMFTTQIFWESELQELQPKSAALVSRSTSYTWPK